jgi:hypothetical protein
LWRTQGAADARKYAPELVEDGFMRAIHRHHHLAVVATFVLPLALGFVLTGTSHGALTALLWAGLVRAFVLHYVTWSVNSVCHFFGRRRFAIDDHSTNVVWLALPSLGEAWHHNHHALRPFRVPRTEALGSRARALRVDHPCDAPCRIRLERHRHRSGASGRPRKYPCDLTPEVGGAGAGHAMGCWRSQPARSTASNRWTELPGTARAAAANY